MKKAAKGILGLSAVLVALGGGLAALKLTEPAAVPDETSSSSEADPGEAVVLINDPNVTGTDPDTGLDLEGVIKSVDVKNQTDELHVIMKTPKTEDSGATYTLKGYEDVNLNTSVVGTLANNANGLLSAATIEENCENPDKFGLKTPEITIKVTYETGSEKTLFIGNETPQGGTYYVMTDDSNTVYTVSSSTLANYSKTLFDFVRTTIVEEPDSSEYPTVESLRIEREDLDYDILLKYDELSDDENYHGGTSASHVMVEPVEAYISVERSTDITNGIFGLSSKGIYSVKCTEADIAEAGLKEPFCTVTMECSDNAGEVLLLSEPFTDTDNEKCCYAMLEGGNVIYIVSTEKAKWATVMPIDIASRIFIASYVWNISDMKIETENGDSFEFVSKANYEEKPDSLSSSDFDVTMNGETFDSERYRKFYSFVNTAAAEEFALDEPVPSGEPMATFEYTDSYTNETFSISFYKHSNLTAQVVVNGKSKFFITKSFVDTLISNTHKLTTDEEFVTTWK